MNQQFEPIQKFGQDSVEASLKSFEAASRGVQAIGAEATDYAKKSFEHSTATLERLLGVKTLDKAIEIQTDYLKSAYDGFVAQATKFSELYTSVAKDVFKPYEGL
ncbi:phasin family protein, partial [Microvirga massiliensis]|uniref:phasin family protein n=1 Tax=Microvirga massiliensis TaxID=1033741 RepID=UPI00062B7DFD